MITALKSSCGAIFMAIVVYYISHLTDWSLMGRSPVKALVLGSAIAAGMAVYALIVRLLRSEEALELVAVVKGRLDRKNG